ncbi:hypothetical protein NN561_015564 [Cricetulus griseus]
MRIIAASRSETPWHRPVPEVFSTGSVQHSEYPLGLVPCVAEDLQRLRPKTPRISSSPLLRDFLKGGRNEHGALSRLLGPDSGLSTLRVHAMNRREEQAFPKLLEHDDRK